MQPPVAVFFDFDGVILDSLGVKAKAMAELFADRPEHVAAIVRHHLDNAGVSRYDKFRHYYAAFFKEPLGPERLDELDRRFTHLCDAGMREAAFVPGAREFLSAWYTRLPLFVVSGAPQKDVDLVVGQRGLSRFFRSVHGSPTSKAEHLRRLLSEHALDPERCLFVGDARADQEAAAACGVPFVQRLSEHTPEAFLPAPAAVLPDLTGLERLWAPGWRLALASQSPSPGRGGRWLYLGRDTQALRRWEAGLGPEWTRIDAARSLQEEAARLRRPYLDWVERLDRRHGDDPDWWAGILPEKNPLAEPFFLYLCGLAVLRSLPRTGAAPDLVVCESAGLAADAARLSGAPRPACLRAELGDLAKTAARWALFLAAAARAALSRPLRRELPAAGERTVLFATYLQDGSLGPDGRFRDRYFHGLAARLAGKGWTPWILPTPYFPLPDPGALKAWLAASPDRFVLPGDWLTAADHLGALCGGLRAAARDVRAGRIDGLDVSGLVAETRRREARSRECQDARLRWRLVRRLARGGFRPALVLSWYENLRAEKALAWGARRWWPEADHAGYFSITPNPNYLPPVPLAAEAAVLPRRLVCCGRHQRAVLEHDGAALPLSVGPALRFGHVWDGASGTAPLAAVLTPLPSRLEEASEIVRTCLAALPLCPAAREWWFCPHPDYTMGELEAVLPPGPWAPGARLSGEPFAGLLPRCAAVATAASGTAVEALTAGVPVVVLGRRTDLDFNPLAYFEGAAPVCQGPAELAAAVAAILAGGAPRRAAAAELGAAVRARCFEPVTDASLAAF